VGSWTCIVLYLLDFVFHSIGCCVFVVFTIVAFVCTINEFVGHDDPNYRESGPLR
jgi:hypothetical protein